MKDLARFAVCIVLVGCGGSSVAIQRPLVGPAVLQGDLVYDAAYGQVAIYSYPGGSKVGVLTGFSNAAGICSDTGGNIWVVDETTGGRKSTLFEYAHGGSTPIATLHLQQQGAETCAVDPSTGDLAVGTKKSEVAIWKKGSGSPKIYSTLGFVKSVQTMTYDDEDNLYMRSYRSGNTGWLPKGGSAVERFDVYQLGAYSWDGTRLVITGLSKGYAEPITEYELIGNSGKVVGHVSLKDCAVYNLTHYSKHYEPSLSIEGSALAITCGLNETASLNFYKYPAGGKPIKSIYGLAGHVAISVGSITR